MDSGIWTEDLNFTYSLSILITQQTLYLNALHAKFTSFKTVDENFRVAENFNLMRYASTRKLRAGHNCELCSLHYSCCFCSVSTFFLMSKSRRAKALFQKLRDIRWEQCHSRENKFWNIALSFVCSNDGIGLLPSDYEREIFDAETWKKL